MELFLSYYFDADRDLDAHLRGDEPEQAGRVSQAIEQAVRVIESWAIRSNGKMVMENGTEGVLQMPADRLEELHDIVQQVEAGTGSRMHVGVGAEPSEAEVALVVAKHRTGIVLYTPDISDEAQEIETQEEQGTEEQQLAEDGLGHLGKAAFNEPKQGGEATRVAQGDLSPMHAAPSPASPVSISPAAQPGQEQGAPPPQAPPGAAQNGDQLSQAIGEVLMDFKKQVPFFEQVKQQNPQAYEAVMGLVQAMLALADQVTGGNAQAEPPQHPAPPPEEPAQKSERRLLQQG